MESGGARVVVSGRARLRSLAGPVLLAVVVIGVPVLWGTVQMQQYDMSTRLDVFVVYEQSPLMLVMPLLAGWAGTSRLYAELGHRHLANVRARQSPRTLLGRRLRRGFLTPAVIFAASVVAVWVIVFLVWPLLGDPHVDPGGNSLQGAQQIAAFDRTLTGLSQFTVFGYPVFGAVYAAWTGFAAGVYGAFAAAMMVLLQNRVLGLVVPMGVYLVETIAAAVIVHPQAALMYSFAPSALQQPPVIVTTGPTLVLAVAVGLCWAVIVRRRHELTVLR